MPTIFEPDDFELRWPPPLFVDEANRLLRRRSTATSERFQQAGTHPFSNLLRVDMSRTDIEWLLAEAFVSTVPVETFQQLPTSGHAKSQLSRHAWFLRLIGAAATWPEPSHRKPYWSARRAAGQSSQRRMEFVDVTRSFVQLIDEFEANGYLAHAFGQECVDDRDGPPLPDRSTILEKRVGYPVANWPLEESRSGWELDDFCDLIEVFHDLVARPTDRSWHSYSSCGWHYSAFATGPARRLYRWRLNRLLANSDLGLRLAEEGEDSGRLVRVEPTGLEDLPEKAMQTATPETVDRVQHAIALFRSRTATVEDRRSAVISLAGVLEERRSLLKAELLRDDEGALFQIANRFGIRHQGADQRTDYDDAFLDWLFWWYLGTVQLTNQLLARHSPPAPSSVRPGDIMQLMRHGDLEDDK